MVPDAHAGVPRSVFVTHIAATETAQEEDPEPGERQNNILLYACVFSNAIRRVVGGGEEQGLEA